MKTNQYVQEKLTTIRKWMNKNGLDGLVVTYNTDQFYLTNFYFYTEEAIFLITAKKALAITRGLYEKPFGKFAPYMQVIGCEGNRPQFLLDQIKKLGLKKVGFDAAHEPYPTGKLFREHGLLEVPSFISTLRATKNEQEHKILRASNRLAYLTYEYIKPRIKTGMTEFEVAAEMERFMRIHGAKSTSFFTIVAFGENAANPHHETGSRKLKANDAVLLDFGCVYHGYCSDMTRSWWHGNKEPAEYKKIWQIVDNARKEGIKAAKIGVACKQVDATCRDLITRAGYGGYFTHGTGHGVGIEIHEDPYNNQTSKHVLQKGNVVSVEPGIYLPGKFGVRLEDTVIITETGAKILTRK
ncbi:MAG: aminopeptidase P family protein [Elusimicrobiaceae bacterium]|nr:aminopeptidase P family protein [Elusimicrobiaceae bacterium]